MTGETVQTRLALPIWIKHVGYIHVIDEVRIICQYSFVGSIFLSKLN